MRMTPQQFLDCERKCITLLGMSGVGKTTLADKLPKGRWFHYSGDYRIGTRYLVEPILDNIKRQAMDVPFLRELLLSDSIFIRSNITVDNLAPISTFLGKLGNPALGGLSLEEFKRRQALHRHAEIMAMRDVQTFIEKAYDIYGYRHFINDAGGSVCELDDPDTLRSLADSTIIIYIRTSAELEHLLIERAASDPKPLYYRAEFLDGQLAEFMRERHFQRVDEIPPNDFVSWMFPRLFRSRLPRYQAIADQFGYTVDVQDAAEVRNEQDFLTLVSDALAR